MPKRYSTWFLVDGSMRNRSGSLITNDFLILRNFHKLLGTGCREVTPRGFQEESLSNLSVAQLKDEFLIFSIVQEPISSKSPAENRKVFWRIIRGEIDHYCLSIMYVSLGVIFLNRNLPDDQARIPLAFRGRVQETSRATSD